MAKNFLRTLHWSISAATSAKFTLEMCVAARNREKFRWNQLQINRSV